MKILRFIILLTLSAFHSQAQVGIGTENPNPKSVLDLKSQGNNQGFLVPRLTTSQRTATSFTNTLTSTEKGLLIFDTDTNKFYYWNGTVWIVIEDSTGTDSQTLSFNPVTGLLNITGGNNVNLSGTPPGGTAGGDLTGTYPNPTITNNAITTAKILDGTVTNADINNAAAIAIAKISGGTNGQILLTSGTTPTWTTMPPPSGAAGGDLTGAYPNPTVSSNAISSAKILDGTILNADLANGSVSDVKIAAGITPSKITSGTAGQVLTTVAGVSTWTTPASGGSVTNVATGAGLSGGPITTTGTISLANTAVTAGTYGSLTQIPQVIVDGQGRITGASNLTVTGFAPNGAAGGDLTGTYPNPTVANNIITSAKITDGSIVNADINNTAAIAINKIAGGTNGQVLLTTGTTPTWSTLPPPSGAAGGDLTGTYPNPTVANNAVNSLKILDGTIATVDIANLAINDSKIASGVAVNKLTAGILNQVLTTTAGGTAWANLPASGTVTSITAGIGLNGGTVTNAGTISLSNSGVTAGTYGSATQVANFNVDAQGRLITAGNTTITGTLPGGAAGGDLTGTYPNPTVARIQARPILNTAPAVNQVLKWNGAAWAPAVDNNSAFILPYSATQADGGPLFSLDNTGSGPASQFVISNPSTKDYALQASTAGGTGGAGLFQASNAAGTGAGVEAITDGVGNAILARSTNTGSSAPAIEATAVGANPAIRGGGAGIGIWGYGGVAGVNTAAFGAIGQYLGSGVGYGVYGSSANSEGYAGFFAGRVNITGSLNIGGTLSKAMGTFKIDHPLDPTNKFLYHSFVESPDMKNIYDGMVTLDANGEAEILLPEYFEALNKDFRYQLTCVGGFANVYVSKEVSSNRFIIAGGRPNLKVSWQVTGIRKDPYAERNRVQVEVEKSGEERGKYLYPAVYGAPESMGINKVVMPDVNRLFKKQ